MQGYNHYISALVLSCVLLFSVVSLFINGLLLYILPKVRDLKQYAGTQLLIGVAVIDIISSIISISMCVTRVILGYPGNLESGWYCPIFSSSIFYTHGVSGVLLSFVALERFTLICLNKKLPLIVVWVGLGVVTIAYAYPVFGHAIYGGFMPDATHIYCFPIDSDIADLANNSTEVVYSIPLVILTVCYTSILIRCLYQQQTKVSHLSKQAALRALFFMVVYLLCYLPKFVETIWRIVSTVEEVPLWISVLLPICLLFVWPLNPILVLFLHNDVKNSIIRVLGFSKMCMMKA